MKFEIELDDRELEIKIKEAVTKALLTEAKNWSSSYYHSSMTTLVTKMVKAELEKYKPSDIKDAVSLAFQKYVERYNIHEMVAEMVDQLDKKKEKR